MTQRYRKPKRYQAMFRLSSDWKRTLRRAWSVRFLALALFFSAAEITLPLFIDDIPRLLFAALTVVAVAGAFWSRLVVQNGLK